jgi:outer membrane receptor protein involved in Fe transport
VKVYWNRFHAPFRFVLFGLDESVDNDTYVVDLTRRARLGGRNNLAAGGSLRLDHFDITIAPDDHGRINGAAFIEDRIAINPTLSVVAGGRLDKFDTTGAAFAPRLSVVVTPAAAHSFRASYNRAYRAPSLIENFANLSLPAYVPLATPFFYTQYAFGSTDLKMEKQDAGEIGYTAVIGSHAVVTATAYTQRIRNDIWFLPVSFYSPAEPPPGWPGSPATVPVLPKVFSFVNLAEVRDRGIELASNVEWSRLSFQGSYTYQRTPGLKAPFPLQINRPAKHQAGGGVIYTAPRWTAGGDIHFTDRAFWADVLNEPFWGYTSSYVAVNARATYRPRQQPWELWVSSTDLFDRKIKTHVFGDTLRRKITAGIRWQWRG